MAIISTIVFGIFILQVFITAAPSEDNVATPSDHVTLDSLPNEIASIVNIENNSGDSKRQKRFYDYIDFKYPPFYPGSFPYPGHLPHSKRDESAHTGVYNTDAAFTQIFRRLREILDDAKQFAHTSPAPSPPPPVSHFTGFIPLFYIPPAAIGGCSCTNTAHHSVPAVPTSTPQTNVNDNKQGIETTTQDLGNRFLGIDDKRQNWGILVNGTKPIVDLTNDGKRPISFDPVFTDEDISISLPPVEHGSVQAGLQPEQLTTTVRPTTTTRFSITHKPTDAYIPPFTTFGPQSRSPSVCDEAVITCCMQTYIAPNCFELNNCHDTSIYGDPCSTEVVLNLIKKKLYYIKQRNGINV